MMDAAALAVPTPASTPRTPLIVHAQIVEALGKRKDVVEVFAFDPILVLARRVALIGSRLEERDHHDFDRDWRWCGRTNAGRREDQEKKRQQSSAHTGA